MRALKNILLIFSLLGLFNLAGSVYGAEEESTLSGFVLLAKPGQPFIANQSAPFHKEKLEQQRHQTPAAAGFSKGMFILPDSGSNAAFDSFRIYPDGPDTSRSSGLDPPIFTA